MWPRLGSNLARRDCGVRFLSRAKNSARLPRAVGSSTWNKIRKRNTASPTHHDDVSLACTSKPAAPRTSPKARIVLSARPIGRKPFSLWRLKTNALAKRLPSENDDSQMLYDAVPKKWFVWTRWGRVGEVGSSAVLGPFQGEDVASTAFNKKFRWVRQGS